MLVQLLTSTIQSLCSSIPETLLHVTLKRRAEISADIFAHLLQYFFLSCKNLTIIEVNGIYLGAFNYFVTCWTLQVVPIAAVATFTLFSPVRGEKYS